MSITPRTKRRHAAQAILRDAATALHRLDPNVRVNLVASWPEDGDAAFIKSTEAGLLEPRVKEGTA